MTDFKKAMFEKRIEKLDELKPVSITWKGQSVQIDNFEKINQLMFQAVEDDLKNVQEVPGGWNNMRAEATQVEQLKKAIFIAYINDTDDFKESIYNEKAQVKKYTVSFDKNATDATGTMAAQEFEHGKEQVLSKNQFERIGYDFIGWKDINGNIYVVVNPKITGINHVPVINAIDKVLTVGDKFDPLDGVTAFDEEDKDITLTQANIIANNVDTSVAGTYNVTYKVTDKDGASTVKTITVTVKAKDIVDKPDDDTSKPDVPNDGTSKPDVPNDGTSKPNKPNINPQTGDVASVGLLQSIIVGSTSILALLLGNRKKRKR